MKIQIAFFTEQGKKTAYRIADNFSECAQVDFYNKENDNLDEWTKEGFDKKSTIIFVGAVGIAVRMISSFVINKLTDSPVIVVDEKGKFVIPILSGHVGGANEIARRLSKCLEAIPVITTATDINNLFSADVFAVKNHFEIMHKKGIQIVASKILEKKRVTISFPRERCSCLNIPSELTYVAYPPVDEVDIVISEDDEILKRAQLPLRPKEYVFGIGCKKGKTCAEIESIVNRITEETGIQLSHVCAVASIDIKKEEAGLIEFADKNRIEFITYTKDELLQVQGEFTSSEFVKNIVGVDNVCERAAIRCAGKNGQLLYKKTAMDGVTLAIARRDWRVNFE